MSSKARTDFERKLVSGLSECGVSEGDSLLVALSGGPDSTALLVGLNALASELGIEVEAAHFNHKTRGEESDLDEKFCRDLCQSLRIEGNFGSMPQKTAAKLSEATMRDARYRFLINVAVSKQFSGVVTGHTLDDQVETSLLAMTRGAGLRGLTGMDAVSIRTGSDSGSAVKVFRPILRARKSEAAAYCLDSGFSPREDLSNRDLGYARNRMRHRVLPELEKLNSKVVESIARMTDNLRDDQALIDDTVARLQARASLSTPSELSRKVLAETPPEALSRILVASFTFASGTRVDLEQAHIRAMMEMAKGSSGRSLDLPNSVQMIVDHDVIRFVSSDSEEDGCPFPVSINRTGIGAPGSATFPGGSVVRMEIRKRPASLESLGRWEAALNPDLATRSLHIRSREAGDRIQPLGMSTPMKLQDFMVNAHIPARWRDRAPLLVSERGIAWAIGYRISEWAKLPPEAENALMVEYTPASITEYERA